MNVGDIGVPISATVTRDGAALNISSATLIQFLIRPPNGTTKTFTGNFVTTGTDGQVRYVTVLTSDIDVAGTWSIQVRIVTPTSDFKTLVGSFTVGANI